MVFNWHKFIQFYNLCTIMSIKIQLEPSDATFTQMLIWDCCSVLVDY